MEETRGRILVVDDEPAVRELCRRLLTAAEYSVQLALSADDALQQLRSGDFDFLLTDIAMPGTLNGAELLNTIKRRSSNMDVVVMTAFPTFETAISTMKDGAYDFLIKPFDTHALLSVVERCFNKRRLSDELNKERMLRLELESAYVELQKVEALKEAFLGRISHELRTPFTAVFFSLEEFESQEQSSSKQAELKSLRNGVEKVWEIVEELIYFSDLKKNAPGESQPGAAPVDLAAILENVVQRFRSESELKRLRVSLTVADEAGSLEGNKDQLETVAKHLFLNAVRFNNPGGEIRLELGDEAGFLRLSVLDTGIGVPADKQSMIFDGFYQAADYLTREVGGLGLGLAIVRRIVEAHHGHIKILSRDAGGSEFRVLLPRSRKRIHQAVGQ